MPDPWPKQRARQRLGVVSPCTQTATGPWRGPIIIVGHARPGQLCNTGSRKRCPPVRGSPSRVGWRSITKRDRNHLAYQGGETSIIYAAPPPVQGCAAWSSVQMRAHTAVFEQGDPRRLTGVRSQSIVSPRRCHWQKCKRPWAMGFSALPRWSRAVVSMLVRR